MDYAKARAAKTGAPFDLVPEDIVIPAVCPVLDLPLDPQVNSNIAMSPSLDRIDPARGYVRGNVRVISWRANRIRSDATADELEAVAKYARELQPQI